MPPFQNTPLTVVTCERCQQGFRTKRPNLARRCPDCKGKGRVRPYDSDYRRQRYAGLSAERKAAMLAKGNERNRRVKRWIAEYKLARGCADCGYAGHHAALDFDHITGEKELNVCFAKSIAQAQREALKCDVVCANCHRIRTYERLNPCKPDIFDATYEPAYEPGDGES